MFAGFLAIRGRSQRVKIRDQIVHLCLRQHPPECWHLRPPKHDDISHAIVVGGHTARHELLLEEPLQTRSAQSARNVCIMTFLAVLLPYATPVRLLSIQTKLGIRLLRFGLTSAEQKQGTRNDCEREDPSKLVFHAWAPQI